MRRDRTIKRMQERVEQLIARFDEYVEEFNQRNLFSGPTVYFHNKTLAVLRQYDESFEALDDDRFFDYLYATLTSWGLHRLGPAGAKLTELEEIKKSLKSQKAQIFRLQPLEITSIPLGRVHEVASDLWAILDGMVVSATKTKIVANSKALHHVLPNLMPPIDREYILRFFYNHTNLTRSGGTVFKEIYPLFLKIASACRVSILTHIGSGMNTSQTKVIDNAIIGFVLKEIKAKRS